MPNSDKKQQIVLTQEAYQQLRRLQQKAEDPTPQETIRRALATYDALIDFITDGGKVKLVDKEGREREFKFFGLTTE